jgi:hypothetical protein
VIDDQTHQIIEPIDIRLRRSSPSPGQDRRRASQESGSKFTTGDQKSALPPAPGRNKINFHPFFDIYPGLVNQMDN